MPKADMRLESIGTEASILLRKPLHKRTPIVIAALVFSALLLITLLMYRAVERLLTEQAQEKLEYKTQEAGLEIKSQMEKYSTYLFSAQGLFAASREVDRAEWRAFVSTFRLFDDYNGVVATAFIKHVKLAEKAIFINEVREDRSLTAAGYPDFKIFPEGDRNEFAVLDFIEPESEQKDIMGYDVASEQIRSIALAHARDTGLPTITGALQLVQDENRVPSIAIYIPIYKNGELVDSPTRRREAIVGYVGLAIRTRDVFSDLFKNKEGFSNFQLRIYDGDEFGQGLPDAQLLFEHDPVMLSKNASEKLISASFGIKSAERVWTIQSDAGLEFYGEVVNKRMSFFVFLVGLLFSMLTATILYLLLSSRYRAEHSAFKMFEELKKTENIFRVMNDSSPLGIFLTDAAGKNQYCNKNCLKIAGLTTEDSFGAGWINAVHPQDRDHVMEEWQKAVKTKNSFELQHRFLRKDGTIVWAHTRTEPVLQQGEIIGYVGILDDVSDRMLMDIAVRESEQYNRNLFDQSPIGLILCDMGYSIVDVNTMFVNTVGFTHKECLSFNQNNFIPSAFHHEMEKHKECLRVDGAHGPIEVELLHKNGKTVPVRIWSVIIEKQDTPYIISSIEDITDRKKVEESLRKAQDDLIEAEKVSTIAKLASGAAHEIKNPLSILLQGMEYLNNKLNKKDSEISGMLSDMNAAVKRTNAIVGNLLSVSVLSDFAPDKEDLNSILDSVILLMKNDFDRNNVKVYSKLASGLPRVLLDRNKVVQILANLLSNAIDAMSDHGGPLTLETKFVAAPTQGTGDPQNISKNGQHGLISLEITDSGSGIPEDILHQIFEPFFTTKRNKGGTGLGLPLVRSIVQMHGGSISLENRKDTNGVKATILFPV